MNLHPFTGGSQHHEGHDTLGVLVIFSFLVFLLLDDLPLFPNLWIVFSSAALQRPIPLVLYVCS